MKKALCFLFMFFLIGINVAGQNYKNDDSEVKIDNRFISRIITIENGKVTTRSLRLKGYPYNFVSIETEDPDNYKPTEGYNEVRGPDPEEFSFTANDKLVTGKTGWKLIEAKKITEGRGSGYILDLEGTTSINNNLFN